MGDIRKQLEIMKSGVGPNHQRTVDKEGERYDCLWVGNLIDRISGTFYSGVRQIGYVCWSDRSSSLRLPLFPSRALFHLSLLISIYLHFHWPCSYLFPPSPFPLHHNIHPHLHFHKRLFLYLHSTFIIISFISTKGLSFPSSLVSSMIFLSFLPFIFCSSSFCDGRRRGF